MDVEQESAPNGDIRLRIRKAGFGAPDPDEFHISYTINNAMVGTPENQELYFNTNGTAWPNGFKEFRAILTLDPELADARSGPFTCYQGPAGSRARCDARVSDSQFRLDLPDGLGPRENVTFAVGFQPGTVSDPVPPFAGRSHGWWGIAGLVGIGLIAVAIALVIRRRASNLDRGEEGVVTQFDPPKDLLPIAAADFLGLPERGAAAHLAWLVVEGRARIHSSEEASAAADDDHVSTSTLRRLADDMTIVWDSEGMSREQIKITQELFGQPGTRRRLSSAISGTAMEQAQRLRDNVVENASLRRRSEAGARLFWIGYIAIFCYGFLQILLGLAGLGWWFLLAGLVGVLLLVLARHLAPVHVGLTVNGQEVRRHLMGLKKFVAMSESGRISWLQNAASAPRDEEGRLHLYKKLLPWAIVFGEERSWRRMLGDMYTRFPSVTVPPMTRFAPLVADVSNYHFQREHWPRHHSAWSELPSFGHGGISNGLRDLRASAAEWASGRDSDDSSTSSSGRGWFGGSSSG